MKKTELKDFEEGILKGDTVIKESYPLEEKKKLTIRYELSKMFYQGDEHSHADALINYCCADAKGLFFVNNTVQGTANFTKMMYQGMPVDECPFCGAEIVIKN